MPPTVLNKHFTSTQYSVWSQSYQQHLPQPRNYFFLLETFLSITGQHTLVFFLFPQLTLICLSHQTLKCKYFNTQLQSSSIWTPFWDRHYYYYSCLIDENTVAQGDSIIRFNQLLGNPGILRDMAINTTEPILFTASLTHFLWPSIQEAGHSYTHSTFCGVLSN